MSIKESVLSILQEAASAPTNVAECETSTSKKSGTSTQTSATLHVGASNSTYISGEALSKQLGVSRAAIWKAIQGLRNDGYTITAITNKGYMLHTDNSKLNTDTIRLALPNNLRTTQLLVYDTIDSTNLKAKQLLVQGDLKLEYPSLDSSTPELDNSEARGSNSDNLKPDNPDNSKLDLKPLRLNPGAVILANQQTAGKGRLDRNFHSPQGGLYMSIIIEPKFDINQATLVTVAAAVAVADSIEEICGQKAEIKWVNDIYVNKKKVCGVLTEAMSDFESGRIANIIIGIGINTSEDSLPKELANIAGAVTGDYDKNILAAKIIENTLNNLGQLTDSTKAPAFVRQYKNKSLLIGRKITVYKGVYREDPTVELGGTMAKAIDIDDQGGLEVKYLNGDTEILRTGEVSVRLDKEEL